MLPEFDLILPQSLPEALRCLAEGQGEIVPIAGGTNVVVDLRSRRHTPKTVLNIENLPELKGIRREDGPVRIGAGTTIAELLKSPLIQETAQSLVEAAHQFANPLVRNRATIGGNLADASPAADTAPALLALDAEVELTSLAGVRCLPLEDFFVHVRKTCLKANELITAVRFPVPAPRSASAYAKLGLRKADAISVVSAAVTVTVDEQGICRKARIALGSVAPRPLRAHKAEEALMGKALTPETIAAAARLAADEVAPISDIRGSAAYRQRMVGVYTRRLLEQAAAKLSQVE